MNLFISSSLSNPLSYFSYDVTQVPSFNLLTHKVTTKIFDTLSNPVCLGITGFSFAYYSICHLTPMYTPFFFADRRSPKTMKKEAPERAKLLNDLTEGVRKHAKIMGIQWANQINVRFGCANGSYGCRFSIGGPLLLISENEASQFIDISGKLNDSGQRLIGHELTHIKEYHAFWSMPWRIMSFAISAGLFVAMQGLVPTIPIISKIVSIAMFVFRRTITGFITGPLDRYLERRADRGAVNLIPNHKHACKIAQAGQQYFADKASRNLALRNQPITLSNIKAICWYRLCINDKGERRFDFTHPGYMERIAAFKKDEEFTAFYKKL